MTVEFLTGASDENRTHVVSLEGWSSTIELHSHLEMVSRRGIEPPTHWLKVSCSTTWATGTTFIKWLGQLGSNQRNVRVKVWCLTAWLCPKTWKWWRGADSNCRTRWELSYSQPRLATSLPLRFHKMVPSIGIEPTTYWLQISCSANWAKTA